VIVNLDRDGKNILPADCARAPSRGSLTSDRETRFSTRVESCTMLTTAPNELVGKVHHRMPVMLTSSEQWDKWLDPEIIERRPLEELFRPTDAAAMASYPVT
jgi:putative SOS response-associated peptidase YedK